MKKILILLIFSFLSLYANEDNENSYELGNGVQVASLPLYIGGYVSLDYKSTNKEDIYRIDDVAFLGYGNYDKFSYMAEFEYKSFYVHTDSQATSTVKQDTNLHTERLYIDYNLNENYIFRAGKYNSPIGYWNLLPVNVLRDTTSSPITSSILFPQYTTGLGSSYSSYGNSEFKIDLMLQKNKDLDAGYNNYEIDEHLGLGFTYSKNNLSLKFNAGIFNLIQYHTGVNSENDEDEHDEDEDERNELKQPERYYALISAKYESENFKLMGEMGSQRSEEDFTTSYAGYIQGAYYFNDKHTAILRIESYEEKVLKKSENFGVIGYTYRPIFPIAIKTEYQAHSISKNDKFLFSFSVMF